MSDRRDTHRGGKPRAVSNTGPLISAFQCGRADLLEAFYEVIFIPAAEVAEFEEHGASDDLQALVDRGAVVVVELTDQEQARAASIAQRVASWPSTRNANASAHMAEAQAMALMERESLDATVFLVEERAAFALAEELQLNPTGFVGTLVKAAAAELLTVEEVRTVLETCRRHGTHYSRLKQTG